MLSIQNHGSFLNLANDSKGSDFSISVEPVIREQETHLGFTNSKGLHKMVNIKTVSFKSRHASYANKSFEVYEEVTLEIDIRELIEGGGTKSTQKYTIRLSRDEAHEVTGAEV